MSNWRSSVIVKGNLSQNILFVFPTLKCIIRKELMSGMSKIYCNSALGDEFKIQSNIRDGAICKRWTTC